MSAAGPAPAELRDAQRNAPWDATLWRDQTGAEQPFLEHYLDAASPFFGRAGVLAALDGWLASHTPRSVTTTRRRGWRSSSGPAIC